MDEELCTLGGTDLNTKTEDLFPASAGDSPQPLSLQSMPVLSSGGVESGRIRFARGLRMQHCKRQATLAPLPLACIRKGFPFLDAAVDLHPLQVLNG